MEQMLLGHIVQAMMHGLQISMRNFIQEVEQDLFLLVEHQTKLLDYMLMITIIEYLLTKIQIPMETTSLI